MTPEELKNSFRPGYYETYRAMPAPVALTETPTRYGKRRSRR
jgi:hypothetical protein